MCAGKSYLLKSYPCVNIRGSRGMLMAHKICSNAWTLRAAGTRHTQEES